MRACVRAWNEKDATPSSFLQTLFLYLIYMKPNTSFPPLGKVTDWETLRTCIQVQRRGHLCVITSEEIVCRQLQTPFFGKNKNAPKITQNTWKCSLLN